MENLQKNKFMYKSPKNRKDNMTLIIGIKLKEGIILIGDRKISTGDEHPFFMDKIKAPIMARVAVGAAGLRDLSKEFNRKIVNQVNSRTAEYRLANIKQFNGTGINFLDAENGKRKDIALPYNYNVENFLDDCSLIIKNLSEIGEEVQQNPIEALVAAHTDKYSLYRIYYNGYKQEGDCFAIGSGSVHIQGFLSQLDFKSLTIGNAIYIGSFLIKYVELMGLDDGVGVEKDRLPQIFLVTDKFAKEYEISKEDTKYILKDVSNKIKKIKKQFTFA